MKTIVLQTKEQLDIYMNPQRQRLLRAMERTSLAKTPKELSLELNISPSSIQYHLKKLESLNLVYLDHTANVHGITAKYYAASRVTVRIGGEHQDDLSGEREIIMRQSIANVLDDTLKVMEKSKKRDCDVMTGILHLTDAQASGLQKLILQYLKEHNDPEEKTKPYEYAFMYHKMGEEK